MASEAQAEAEAEEQQQQQYEEPSRFDLAKLEEESGKLQIHLISNDGNRQNTEWLLAYKDVVHSQLSEMQLEHIFRIIFDPRCRFNHRTLIALKPRKSKVIGGICFRTFADRGFIEIVFVAVQHSKHFKARHTPLGPQRTADGQGHQGYGRHLMNHLKELMKKEHIYYFLTFADETATDFFRKQARLPSFLALRQSAEQGRAGEYVRSTLVECFVHPRVPYLCTPAAIRLQRRALYDLALQVKAASLCLPGLGADDDDDDDPDPAAEAEAEAEAEAGLGHDDALLHQQQQQQQRLLSGDEGRDSEALAPCRSSSSEGSSSGPRQLLDEEGSSSAEAEADGEDPLLGPPPDTDAL
eukprot:m51a1_g12515 putative histone acetyl transferase (354) ;mRNA; r:3285-4987